MRAYIYTRSLTVFSRIRLILLQRQQKTVDSSRRRFQQTQILVDVDYSRRGFQQTQILVDVDSSRHEFWQLWILVNVRVYLLSVLLRRSCYNWASPITVPPLQAEGLKWFNLVKTYYLLRLYSCVRWRYRVLLILSLNGLIRIFYPQDGKSLLAQLRR